MKMSPLRQPFAAPLEPTHCQSDTHPPRFPQPTMSAIATARLTSPPNVPPIHASWHATLGRSPAATTTVPTYCAAGVFVANTMAYPTIATAEPARTNGPRTRSRSERKDTANVKTHPVAFGAMERSWALVEE